MANQKRTSTGTNGSTVLLENKAPVIFSKEANIAFESRRRSAKLSPDKRLALVEEDQKGSLRHCQIRLKERYGFKEEEAKSLVFEHLKMIRSDPLRAQQILYRVNVASVYQIADRGRYFYPVLRPGNLSGRHVIVTYLSEDMVWGNMMFEIKLATARHNPRADALKDFYDEDPEYGRENCQDEDRHFLPTFRRMRSAKL
jgi:hypothetical protein